MIKNEFINTQLYHKEKKNYYIYIHIIYIIENTIKQYRKRKRCDDFLGFFS